MKTTEIINVEPFCIPLFIIYQSFRLREGGKKEEKNRQIYPLPAAPPWPSAHGPASSARPAPGPGS